MVAADLDAIQELAQSVPEVPQWTQTAYKSYLPDSGPDRRIFLAEKEEVLAGFVAGQIIVGVCELESIAVDPRFRRHGVGSTLLTSLVDWATQHSALQVELEVRAGNTSAISLYSRFDFHRDGLRPHYYHHPNEDAVLMSLLLRPLPPDRKFPTENH